LATRPYNKNVSISRILFNQDIAREFSRVAPFEEQPDVIFAAYPIPELADAAALYAKQRSIPAVVDIRDLWPDIWLSAVPRYARWVAQAAVVPFQQRYRRTLRRFDGICGTTNEMVEWGLSKAGRSRGPWDRAFPLAYLENRYTDSERRAAEGFWHELLGTRDETHLTLCFFGNMAMQRARIDVMIRAMRILAPNVRRRTRLILCGSGEDFEAVRAMAADIPEVILPGWVTGPQIEALALRSHAGILPYPSGPDFIRSIPNKAIEYLAYGLPILTSLKGPVSNLINDEGCGLVYRETDEVDLARQISALATAPEQLSALSSNARHVFQRYFLASNVYGRLADMLKEVCSATALAKPSA